MSEQTRSGPYWFRRAKQAEERLAAFENLRAVAAKVDRFGEALIHREYEPLSPTVVALVNEAREALAVIDRQDEEA